MQQHPIPQNVTQYQFRLVGDMTLKQFLELALGLVMAYLFFSSNLIFIIKWPLIILSILFGAALAFFPIEDRPLDQWITNFLKAIYAPTRFIWKKTNKIPRLFLFEAHAPDVVTTITKTIKAPSSAMQAAPVSDLSEFESAKITSLDSLFQTIPTSAPSQAPAKHDDIVKPTISVRKLGPASGSIPTVIHSQETKSPVPAATPVTTQVPAPAPLSTAPSAITRRSLDEGGALPTPKSITLPASPKTPNLITGVVVGPTGKLVDSAIVQIVSGDGIPQRAMKTNSLGQFYTSTPLSPGSYVIEVDKLGLTFPKQQLVVKDEILSPVELRATN